MLRTGIACLLLLVACNGALAEASAERGGYLVNTIMACGNCHTPRDADGRAMAEKAFSGGLTWTTPVFIATGLKAADLADIIAYLRTVPPLQ